MTKWPSHQPTPRAEWPDLGQPEHLVQFYKSDAFLVDSLSGFIGTGLQAGEAANVVATAEHRASLEDRLRASGLDVAIASASGHYVP
jgi:hypothetical protein